MHKLSQRFKSFPPAPELEEDTSKQEVKVASPILSMATPQNTTQAVKLFPVLTSRVRLSLGQSSSHQPGKCSSASGTQN